VALRILIVPDKFKGTLTAQAAATAIAAGWRKARPGDRLTTLPMSDGGDGFGEVLGELMGARRQLTRSLDAAHRPLHARWWLADHGKMAIIDSAAIIGLALMAPGKFHPFQLDSFALGQVLRAAAKAGARHAIIGIGGSATNDGGFGLARALGWKFYDKGWGELIEWWQLQGLAYVHPPSEILPLDITVAVDVANPLLGPKGCSRIYGPQKGLQPQDFAWAEKCLDRMASVLRAAECAKTRGAGAAGGLGFGLMAFAGAKLKPGFEIFAQGAKLEKRIAAADLIITGEGRLDRQTYMGKGVGQIARRCAAAKVPCFALAGTILEPARARRLFGQARALTDITDLRGALSKPATHLKQLAWQLAKATR
jgi:glycerate 2-kinase